MDAEGWIAVGALAVSLGHIGVSEYRARRAERSDVRVEVRHDMVEVGSGSYVLTVVVTNHGPVTERIERIGLWFEDTTGIFPPSSAITGQGAQQTDMDVEVPPRGNYRWTYDFGTVRYRHGLGYRPWVLLASGRTIEGAAGVADAYGLNVAGLARLTEPLSDPPAS